MKKAYLLIIAAASVLLSCSKVGPEHSDPNAWMYDESLPVPVMLGTPGAEVLTKVGIGNNDLPTDALGLYALDISAGSEAWATGSESVLLANESVTIDGKDVKFKSTKYYPMVSNHDFTFYSCYPYKVASLTNGQYIATYDLTHKGIDILWAEAAADPYTYTKDDGSNATVNGFNAAYIRKVNDSANTSSAYLPNLKYQHMLTALTFGLKVNASDAQKVKEFKVKITGLQITACKTVQLVIADKNTPDNAGTLIKGSETRVFFLTDATSNTNTFSIDITDDNNKQDDGAYYTYFGSENTGFLLAPEPSDGFEGILTMTTTDANDVTTIHRLPLKFNAGFEAGKQYNFTILIKAPEEITASAEMTEWGDQEEGTVEYPDNDTYND